MSEPAPQSAMRSSKPNGQRIRKLPVRLKKLEIGCEVKPNSTATRC